MGQQAVGSIGSTLLLELRCVRNVLGGLTATYAGGFRSDNIAGSSMNSSPTVAVVINLSQEIAQG